MLRAAVEPFAVLLSLVPCCATADGPDGRGLAVLAARAAKRWLRRNAAGVKLVRTCTAATITVCMNLVFCLPALEDVELTVSKPLKQNDLRSLLEALAGCPHLRALDLSMEACTYESYEDTHWHSSCASAFAKLSSLTKLALAFDEEDVAPNTSVELVGALASLTALAELSLDLPAVDWERDAAVVPGALAQFKGLRSLALYNLGPCVFEARCLDLPNLQGLVLGGCDLGEARVLPGVTALQRLTRIELSCIQGSCFFDPGFAQLPCLQRMVVEKDMPDDDDAGDRSGRIRLPADMGLLSSSLTHLTISGLKQFPLPVTQLSALECLDASGNLFAKLPAGITALSRLTELRLGRVMSEADPLQLHVKQPLDARALGDLSGFPALRELTLHYCEAMLCSSVLGAVRHASLVSLCFRIAHPAPECAPAVLQLSGELRRMRRGSVVTYESEAWPRIRTALQKARGRAPCQKFMAALEAGGP